MDLEWGRLYRSQVAFAGELGEGWCHSFDHRVWSDGAGGILHLDAGSFEIHSYPAAGGQALLDCATPGVYRKARLSQDGYWEIRDRHGDIFRFRSLNESVAAGRMEAMTDPSGNQVTAGYDDTGRLTTLYGDQYQAGVDESWRLEIQYSEGRISSVQDVRGGRTWNYFHDDSGNLVSVSTPPVPTLVGGSEVDQARQTVYTYLAQGSGETSGNLETITYPGHTSSRVRLEYTAEDHVSKAHLRHLEGGSEHATAFKAGSSTLPGSVLKVELTAADGQVSDLHFDAAGGLRQAEDPSGQVTTMTYNSDGEVSLKVLSEGNQLIVDYATAQTVDRFQHGNVVQTRHVPAAGAPGSALSFVVGRNFEPIYNTELPTLDEGGEFLFDYQEDPSSVAGLIQYWGIDTPAIAALGDVNGDGVVSRGAGKLIERRSAPISDGLPPGVQGPIQMIDTWTHDDLGRVLTHADPEGSLTVLSYSGGRLQSQELDVDPASSGALPNAGTSRRTLDPGIAFVNARFDYSYGPLGLVTEVSDPRGVKSSTDYNLLGEETRTESASGFDIAKLDSRLEALRAAGYAHLIELKIVEELAYDPAGNTARERSDNSGSGDALMPWNEVAYEYDLFGRRTKATRLMGSQAQVSSTASYDSVGRLSREVDEEGVVTAYLYDANGRLEHRRVNANADGSAGANTEETSYEYDNDGNLTVIVSPEDLDGDGLRDRELVVLDGRARPLSHVSSTGVELTREYDNLGWISAQETRGVTSGPSPLGNDTSANLTLERIEVDRDAVGQIYQMRNSVFELGSLPGTQEEVTQIARDRTGAIVWYQDAQGNQTEVKRDGLGRPIEISNLTGSIAFHTYDAGGELVETLHLAGDSGGITVHVRKEQWLRDGRGRVLRHVDGGEAMYFAYSSSGDRVAKATGQSSDVGPDPLGLYTDGPIGQPGNPVRVAIELEASGRKLTVGRDSWDSGTSGSGLDLWSVGFDPKAAFPGADSTEVSVIRYDTRGNLLEATSPEGLKVEFEYDEFSRLRVKRLPDGVEHSFSYWMGGLLDNHTVYDSSGTVFRSVDHSYDGDGRLTLEDITADPSLARATHQRSSEWNGLGLLSSRTDLKSTSDFTDSTVTREYDSLGRVLEETQNGLVMLYGQGAGGKTSVQYPSGRSLDLIRDERGRLSTVRNTGSATSIVEYEYLGNGSALAAVNYGNGASKSFRTPTAGGSGSSGYSSAGRPELLQFSTPGVAQTIDLGIQRNQQGDSALRLRAEQGVYTGEAIAHDSRGRARLMQQVINPSSSLVMGVDRDGDGDWTLMAIQKVPGPVNGYAYQKVPQDWAYSSIAGLTLDHDPAGNRVQDAWFDYEFDAFDRLVEVRDRYSSAMVARYSYDGLSRRIEKETWTTAPETMVYEDRRVVEIYSGSSATLTDQFVFGDWIDDAVQWVDASGSVRYFDTDEVGSVHAVRDDQGSVLERVVYDLLGGPTFLDALGGLLVEPDGSPVAESPLGNRLLLQGREYDAELALWRRAQATPGYFAEVPAMGQYDFRYRYLSVEEGRFIGRDPLALTGNNSIDPSILVGRILNGEAESPYEFGSGNRFDEQDPLGMSVIMGADGKALYGGTCFEMKQDKPGGPVKLDIKVPGIGDIPFDLGNLLEEGADVPKSLKNLAKLQKMAKAPGKAIPGLGLIMSVKESLEEETDPLMGGVHYIVGCANPITAFALGLFKSLEEDIHSNRATLPSPSPQPVRANSAKLLKLYRQLEPQVKKAKKDVDKGPGDWREKQRKRIELEKILADMRASARAMSCMEFWEGNGGPLRGTMDPADCKKAWNKFKQQFIDVPGTGHGELYVPSGQGEQASATGPAGLSEDCLLAMHDFSSSPEQPSSGAGYRFPLSSDLVALLQASVLAAWVIRR